MSAFWSGLIKMVDSLQSIFHNVFVYQESLEWRHKERDGVSNHRRLNFLLNHLFSRRSKKTSKLFVTGFCGGIHRWPVNSPHKVHVTQIGNQWVWSMVIKLIICQCTVSSLDRVMAYCLFATSALYEWILSTGPNEANCIEIWIISIFCFENSY